MCFELAPKLLPAGLVFISSCADERPPTGGRRDSIPPKVAYMNPNNKSLNFNSTKITIHFQEYIQPGLDPKEILISPPMEKNPKLLVIGKNLNINLKSKLKENTTYTINFGDAIKDINEGNVLRNFTYVFSTGDKLDTARISGSVINVSDPKTLDNIMVALYPADSIDAILRSKPYYFAKTNKLGLFQIQNIHPGSYRVYALKDENLNYIYDQPTELVGFLDSTITLSDSSNTKFKISVFESINTKPKFIDAYSPSTGKVLFYYNSPIMDLNLTSSPPSNDKIIEYNSTKDTITYWNSNIYDKKIKVQLMVNGTISDTTTVDLKYLNKDSINDKKRYNLSIVQQSLKKDTTSKTGFESFVLSPFKPIILTLSRPVEGIDENKRLLIVNDSTGKIDSVKFMIDSISKRRVTIKYRPEEKGSYTMTIPDSTFLDIWGWWNRKFYYHWNTDLKENYGNITLTVKFIEPGKNYVLKLLDQNNTVIETYLNPGTAEKVFYIKNAKAGTYHLQAIEDANGNGQWDSGDFSKKMQPEKIINFTDTYTLKGNWDLDIEVKIQ